LKGQTRKYSLPDRKIRGGKNGKEKRNVRSQWSIEEGDEEL